MPKNSDHLLSKRLRNVSPSAQTQTRRRAAGPKVVARHLGSVTSTVGRKFGFATSYIVDNWREIVGPEFADHTYPERLITSKSGTAILRVRVPGALAVQIQHHVPEILTRINRHYGFDAVGTIKIAQAPLPQAKGSAASLWDTASPAGRSVKQSSTDFVSEVKNPQVRKYLEQMRKRLAKKDP